MNVENWELEWFHLADTECLFSGMRNEFIKELVDLQDVVVLKELLEDGNSLLPLFRNATNAVTQAKRQRGELTPEEAIPWRNNSGALTLELAATSWNALGQRNIPILTPTHFYIPWPFGENRLDTQEGQVLMESWRTLRDRIDLSVEMKVDEDFDTAIATNHLFNHIDDLLYDQKRRIALGACKDHNDPQDRHQCILEILRTNDVFDRYFKGEVIFDVETDRHKTHSLISSDGNALVFTIGLRGVRDRSPQFLVPDWPCGRFNAQRPTQDN